MAEAIFLLIRSCFQGEKQLSRWNSAKTLFLYFKTLIAQVVCWSDGSFLDDYERILFAVFVPVPSVGFGSLNIFVHPTVLTRIYVSGNISNLRSHQSMEPWKISVHCQVQISFSIGTVEKSYLCGYAFKLPVHNQFHTASELPCHMTKKN
jgi:hypothetical protein